MAGVQLQGVTKIFDGEVRAVDSVDLDIEDGEFVVLVGPSGCGKSTLLRLIAGLEEVSEGTIRLGGQDVTDTLERDRDIAMVFQNYALYPHMTVRRNLGFALRLRRLPAGERERRVEEVARILGLDALMERKPAALSGG
jgi:multiple sugar transport system ATP-binding protein